MNNTKIVAIASMLEDISISSLIDRSSVLDFDVGTFRKNLGLSQIKFTIHYDINVATVKRWEKGANPAFDRKFRQILIDWLHLYHKGILDEIVKKDPLSGISWNYSLEQSRIFQKNVDQLLQYNPSTSFPCWDGQKIDQYPKTLSGLEQFQKDNPK